MIRFVTGTDTGVGKTVVAAALARAEREAGRSVAYHKPVQTGLRPGEPGDADFVAAAGGVPASEGLRLTEPLAPAVAAERAGVAIDAEAMVEECRALAASVDVLVVEGAGGLLVPVVFGGTTAPGRLGDAPFAGAVTMADLAALLGAEVVVATRPGLGTLNHTALTLEAARARGLTVAGLVVCGWPAEPDVTQATNLERLAAMAPVLGLLSHVAGLDTARPGTGTPPELVPAG